MDISMISDSMMVIVTLTVIDNNYLNDCDNYSFFTIIQQVL